MRATATGADGLREFRASEAGRGPRAVHRRYRRVTIAVGGYRGMGEALNVELCARARCVIAAANP